MSLKVIMVCDTCGAEHEQEDVDPSNHMRNYMGEWECSDCMLERVRRERAT